jgi:hypothetical protein
VPFAGACSGALSKATCESATTIAGTTTKATQISFEEIPASRPAKVASNCTTYLEPERRGWPADGGLGATGVAQHKKANVRGSTTGCSHRTRSPIVIRDLSIVLVVFVAAAVVGLTLTMVYAITSSVLTGVVGSSLVMTSSEAIGTFSVAL